MTMREYQSGTTHYADRVIRAAVHERVCRTKGQPACGGAFLCTKCGRIIGWCKGCDEDFPDWCTTCWARSVDARRR